MDQSLLDRMGVCKMKLHIIGIRGMLGSALAVEAQKAGHEIVGYKNIYSLTAPIVINCAGIVKQRRDATASVMADANAALPHILAETCNVYGARLIHVSTDCVFDGSNNAPYTEHDKPTPTDLYSRTKLAGEIYDAPHLTVRTSFVGLGERGLLGEMMRHKDGVIEVPKRARWTGHTTIAISRILLRLAEQDMSGLLHVPGEAVTRIDLIRKLSKAFDLNITIEGTTQPGIDRRLISNRWDELDMPPMQTLDEEIEELCQSQSA